MAACGLPLDGILLSPLLLVFLLKVGPVGLVPNTIILSGDVRGILDHQAIIRAKATILDVLKEPPEGGGILRRCHGSLWSCKEDQIGQAQSEGTTVLHVWPVSGNLLGFPSRRCDPLGLL